MNAIADGFCTQCGNPIYVGNKFCMMCGAPVKPRVVKEKVLTSVTENIDSEPVSLSTEPVFPAETSMKEESHEDTAEIQVQEMPKMYCEYCGAQIDADSLFCIRCGMKV